MRILQLLLLLFCIQTFVTHTQIYQDFIIFIASYNNERWCEKNLLSALDQNYPQQHYRIIYVNDCSTDATGARAQTICQEHAQGALVTFIDNKKRAGALKNFYTIINKQCQPHEIIVTLDGDDWLAHSGVLLYLNQIYSKKNIWLTFGSYQYHPKECQFKPGTKPYPRRIVAAQRFRYHQFLASHPRTFYAWLFHKIKKEDLLDEFGNFYEVCADFAIMLPLLEMVGPRHRCLVPALYVYNIENPLNDNKVNYHLIEKTLQHIKQKRKYRILRKRKKYYLKTAKRPL